MTELSILRVAPANWDALSLVTNIPQDGPTPVVTDEGQTVYADGQWLVCYDSKLHESLLKNEFFKVSDEWDRLMRPFTWYRHIGESARTRRDH